MKKKYKKKIIIRSIQLIVIILTIIITKIAIQYAYLQRGYEAFGGEYLIPVLGFLLVIIIEDIYQNSKKRRKQKNGNHRKNKK